eukprot:2366512-Prymnesium_polylepis.1
MLLDWSEDDRSGPLRRTRLLELLHPEAVCLHEHVARRPEGLRRRGAPDADDVLARLAKPLDERCKVRVGADDCKCVHDVVLVADLHRVGGEQYVRARLALDQRALVHHHEAVIALNA